MICLLLIGLDYPTCVDRIYTAIFPMTTYSHMAEEKRECKWERERERGPMIEKKR